MKFCFCEMNLNWSGDDDSGYPYFAIGANELCNDIPDCISESDNFELSLDQFYYSFPVYSPQICTSVKTTDEDSPLPYKYRVSEPYPNPFNPSVSIDLYLPYERRMKIEVVNNAGNIVNILSNDKVLKDPAFFIGVHTLGDSSVNFVTRSWAKTEDYWAVYFYLQENFKLALDEAGISIPFPQMDVHLNKISE